jgi:glycosyltransferase 2 family protein
MSLPLEPKIRKPAKTLRQRLFFAAKLLVTVAVLGWLFTRLNWSQIGEAFRQANPWLVILAITLNFGGVMLSAFKWQRLLHMHGVQYPYGRLLSWYLVGMFFNKFLPTTIGGDGYRIHKTLDNPKGKSCAVLAVFMERATGSAALLSLGFASAIVLSWRANEEVLQTVITIGAGLIVCGLIVVMLLIRLRVFQRVSAHQKCPKPLKSLLHFAGDFRNRPRTGALIVLLSFVFQLNSVLVTWMLLAAVGASVAVPIVTAVWTVVQCVGMVPISLGGLGVVDAAFVQLMAHYGIPTAVAFSAMLLRRVSVLPFALLGGLIYLVGDREPDSICHPGHRSEISLSPNRIT